MRRLGRYAALLMGLVFGAAHADVRMANASFDVVEGNTLARVIVVLTNQDSASGPVTVNFATAAGSASPTASGLGDYDSTGGTVVWEMGDFEAKAIEVQIRDDAIVEGNETFTVTLSDPFGSVLGSPASTTVTIVDNDNNNPGVFQFAITDYLVFEGGNESLANCPPLTPPNNACLVVRRTGGSAGNASVEVTRVSGGTASPGADFTDTAQVFSWNDGDASNRFFQFRIIDDAFVEPSETIFYRIQNATGGPTIDSARSSATVTIGDNDFDGPGSVQFQSGSGDVVESEGNIQIRVTRTGGSGGTATVDFATRATSPESAGLSDYSVTRGTLTFPSGSNAQQVISVPITNDSTAEGDEQFEVVLSNATVASIGSTNTFTANIIDDDAAGSAYRLNSDRLTVDDTAGSVRIVVSRTNPAQSGAVTVMTEDGSATAGSDYVAVNRVVNFAVGETSQAVDVPVVASGDRSERDETFLVTLQNPVAGDLSSPSTALVTIRNVSGSGALDSVGFRATAVTVDDSGGSAVVQVERTGSGAGPASVSYQTVDGTARAGLDYEARAASLQWSDGDTSVRSISIPIIPPFEAGEPSETFTVELSSPSNASIGSNAFVTVTITPVSSDASVGFDNQGDIELTQTRQSADLIVRRSGATTFALTVSVRSFDGSAVAGSNYVAINQTLQWAAGEGGAKTVPVRGLYANPPTSNLEFDVRLAVESGVAALGTSNVTVSLAAGAPSTVRFANTAVKAQDRSGAATFIVERANAVSAAAVRVRTIDGTARAGEDYVPVDTVINWQAGDGAARLIAVELIPSATPVPSKTFSVTLSPDSSSALTQVDPAAALATARISSGAAEESQGVGGCSMGRSDPFTLPAMLLLALTWLALRRKLRRASID